MKVALIGFGIENQAALRYWQKQGAEISVRDQNPDTAVPEGVDNRLGPQYLEELEYYDIVIRTVGMHPKVILEKHPELEPKLTTAINIFFENCPTPIIGVTGTKGKGTTSSLIVKLLEAAGKKVVLGGNIGIPLLDLVDDAASADYVVTELSSFQLIDFKHRPQIGVCLMVVPEHLNWHDDMDEYLTAKQRLFKLQTANDLAIFNRNNTHSTEIVKISLAKKVSYEVPGPGALPSAKTGAYVEGDTIFMNEVPVCKVTDVALLGRHNLENVCAALAATWEIILHQADLVKKVVSEFTGLEHRLEFVREVDGVRYYDDSFGTTPETAIVAIQAFKQPKVLILGGSTKESDYTALAQVAAANSVRQVILIGNSSHPTHKTAAPAIESALQAAGVVNIVNAVKAGGVSMTEVVHLAQTQAQPGDVVLLSTACASYDMFHNYKKRGEQFKQAVQALA